MCFYGFRYSLNVFIAWIKTLTNPITLVKYIDKVQTVKINSEYFHQMISQYHCLMYGQKKPQYPLPNPSEWGIKPIAITLIIDTYHMDDFKCHMSIANNIGNGILALSGQVPVTVTARH